MTTSRLPVVRCSYTAAAAISNQEEGLELVCGRVQGRVVLGGDIARVPYRRVPGPQGPVGLGTVRLRQVRQDVVPVLSVLFEAGGGPVGAVRVLQHGQRAQRPVLGRTAFRECGVDLGAPACEGPAAVAVQGEMVPTLVPEEQVVSDLDDGRGGQRSTEEIHRLVQLGTHPLRGGRARVGLAAEVDDVDGIVTRVVNVLLRNSVDHAETQTEAFCLVQPLARRSHQQVRIDRAADLQVLGGVKASIARCELLGIPNGELAGHEFPEAAFRCSHSRTLQSFDQSTGTARAASIGACLITAQRSPFTHAATRAFNCSIAAVERPVRAHPEP